MLDSDFANLLLPVSEPGFVTVDCFPNFLHMAPFDTAALPP